MKQMKRHVGYRLLLLRVAGLFALCLYGSQLAAQEVRVAVASNFLAPAKALARAYETAEGVPVKLSSGSTGKLYAQIVNGAPFDIFLAANRREPERLEAEGGAVKGSRFTYALGRLVLWSADARLVEDPRSVLEAGDYRRLALANPRTAPYGAAAVAVLEALGLRQKLDERLVYGENIAQAYQFVATGNAQLGFIARSQLPEGKGSSWIVPEDLYPPIEQQAVLLQRAADKARARAFMEYLRGPEAGALVESFGYGRR